MPDSSSNMIVSLTRKVTASCAHRLYNNTLSEEKNRRIYGKCATQHGHNYTISVTWSGPIDQNGMVIDVYKAKRVLADKIESVIDHKCLDELPYFKSRPSTTENLCVFIAEQLGGVDYGTARITSISVNETENNTFTVTM